MSLEPAVNIYVALVIGALVLAGLVVVGFADLYLRKRGEVRGVIYDWELGISEGAQPSGERAVFLFKGLLFNGTPTPKSLRRPTVELFPRDDAQEEVVARLKDPASGEYLRALELPPRRVVHVRLYASFEGEEARKLAVGFRRACFVGRFWNGGVFVRQISGRGDFVARRKKVGASQKNFAASRKKASADQRYFVASPKKPGLSRKNFARPWWRRPFAPRKL